MTMHVFMTRHIAKGSASDMLRIQHSNKKSDLEGKAPRPFRGGAWERRYLVN